MNQILKFILFSVFFDLCSSLYRFHSDNPFKDNLIGCAELKDVKVGAPFARGQKKQVLRGNYKGMPVVVARPYDGPYWQNTKKHLEQKTLIAGYNHYFEAERKLMDTLESEFAPHFYGGCWASFGTTVLIEEYLRGYMDVASDQTLTWQQRVRIASNTLDLLIFFENFPTSKTNQTKAVYGDFFAKQYAVDEEYHVKVVDMQSFFPYDTPRFGDHYRCTRDSQCQDKFWYASGYPNIMRGLRRFESDDFGCDIYSGFCNGLDKATTLMGLCHMLIEPLFLLGKSSFPAEKFTIVMNLIDQCMERKRDERITKEELKSQFEKLVPANLKFKPLLLTNPDLTHYVDSKDKFVQVRHDAEERRVASLRRKGELPEAAKKKGKGKIDVWHEVDDIFDN